jgi:hypothetical protein
VLATSLTVAHRYRRAMREIMGSREDMRLTSPVSRYASESLACSTDRAEGDSNLSVYSGSGVLAGPCHGNPQLSSVWWTAGT